MVAPYSALAPLWNSVMAHVDYTLWHRYILAIEKKYTFPSRDVLELGGGTGSLASLFTSSDFHWHYSDLSPGMALEAKQRLAEFSIPACVQDCRHVALSRNFGLVVFLYDGINYMMSAEDFLQCLQSVKSVLLPEGYFLFDVTTEFNSKSNFPEVTYFEDLGNSCYARRSYYDDMERIQHNDFNIFTRKADGSYIRSQEYHEQRVYSIPEIQTFARMAGMELCGCWSGFTFKKADTSATRVHFLLRKV